MLNRTKSHHELLAIRQEFFAETEEILTVTERLLQQIAKAYEAQKSAENAHLDEAYQQYSRLNRSAGFLHYEAMQRAAEAAEAALDEMLLQRAVFSPLVMTALQAVQKEMRALLLRYRAGVQVASEEVEALCNTLMDVVLDEREVSSPVATEPVVKKAAEKAPVRKETAQEDFEKTSKDKAEPEAHAAGPTLPVMRFGEEDQDAVPEWMKSAFFLEEEAPVVQGVETAEEETIVEAEMQGREAVPDPQEEDAEEPSAGADETEEFLELSLDDMVLVEDDTTQNDSAEMEAERADFALSEAENIPPLSEEKAPLVEDMQPEGAAGEGRAQAAEDVLISAADISVFEELEQHVESHEPLEINSEKEDVSSAKEASETGAVPEAALLPPYVQKQAMSAPLLDEQAFQEAIMDIVATEKAQALDSVIEDPKGPLVAAPSWQNIAADVGMISTFTQGLLVWLENGVPVEQKAAALEQVQLLEDAVVKLQETLMDESQMPRATLFHEALMLRTEHGRFALPMAWVEGVRQIDEADIKQEDTLSFWEDGQATWQLLPLEVLLTSAQGNAAPFAEKASASFMVFLKDPEHSYALLVQAVEGHSYAPVKELPAFLPHDSCLLGAVVGMDGALVPVLDGTLLLERFRTFEK